MSGPAAPVSTPEDEPRGARFWGAFALGWGLIGFGVWTVFDRAGATRPVEFAAWFLGLAVLHDLLVSPALSFAARAFGSRIPVRWRGIALGAAVVSGSLILVALPPLLGDPADNETLLPRNYAAGLVVALASVWAVAVVSGAVVARRSR